MSKILNASHGHTFVSTSGKKQKKQKNSRKNILGKSIIFHFLLSISAHEWLYVSLMWLSLAAQCVHVCVHECVKPDSKREYIMGLDYVIWLIVRGFVQRLCRCSLCVSEQWDFFLKMFITFPCIKILFEFMSYEVNFRFLCVFDSHSPSALFLLL